MDTLDNDTTGRRKVSKVQHKADKFNLKATTLKKWLWQSSNIFSPQSSVDIQVTLPAQLTNHFVARSIIRVITIAQYHNITILQYYILEIPGTTLSSF